MVRRIFCMLLVTFAMGQMKARALEDSLPSDILVTQRLGEAIVADGSVELCRVGELLEEGYLLDEAFGGGTADSQDVLSPDFAYWMSRRADTGLVLEVNGSGVVRFPSVSPGLYLIRQRQPAEGYYPFRPYLVSITGEMTLVDTYPVMEPKVENPRTAESPEPYFAALGVAVTLTGFLFWDEARRREKQEQSPE